MQLLFSLSIPPPSPQEKLQPSICYNISVYPVLGQQVGQPYTVQAYAKEEGMCGPTLSGRGEGQVSIISYTGLS